MTVIDEKSIEVSIDISEMSANNRNMLEDIKSVVAEPEGAPDFCGAKEQKSPFLHDANSVEIKLMTEEEKSPGTPPTPFLPNQQNEDDGSSPFRKRYPLPEEDGLAIEAGSKDKEVLKAGAAPELIKPRTRETTESMM